MRTTQNIPQAPQEFDVFCTSHLERIYSQGCITSRQTNLQGQDIFNYHNNVPSKIDRMKRNNIDVSSIIIEQSELNATGTATKKFIRKKERQPQQLQLKQECASIELQTEKNILSKIILENKRLRKSIQELTKVIQKLKRNQENLKYNKDLYKGQYYKLYNQKIKQQKKLLLDKKRQNEQQLELAAQKAKIEDAKEQKKISQLEVVIEKLTFQLFQQKQYTTNIQQHLRSLEQQRVRFDQKENHQSQYNKNCDQLKIQSSQNVLQIESNKKIKYQQQQQHVNVDNISNNNANIIIPAEQQRTTKTRQSKSCFKCMNYFEQIRQLKVKLFSNGPVQLTKEISRLQQVQQDHLKSIGLYMSKHAFQQKQISKLKEKIDSLINQNIQFIKQKQQLMLQNNISTQSQLAQYQHFQAQLNQLKDDNEIMSKNLTIFKQQNQVLFEKNQQLQNKLTELVPLLQAEIAQYRAKCSDLQEQNQRLKNDVMEANVLKVDVQNQLAEAYDQLMAQYRRLENQHMQLQDKLKKQQKHARDRLFDLQSQYEAQLKELQTVLEGELVKAKELIQKKDSECVFMSMRICELQAELSRESAAAAAKNHKKKQQEKASTKTINAASSSNAINAAKDVVNDDSIENSRNNDNNSNNSNINSAKEYDFQQHPYNEQGSDADDDEKYNCTLDNLATAHMLRTKIEQLQQQNSQLILQNNHLRNALHYIELEDGLGVRGGHGADCMSSRSKSIILSGVDWQNSSPMSQNQIYRKQLLSQQIGLGLRSGLISGTRYKPAVGASGTGTGAESISGSRVGLDFAFQGDKQLSERIIKLNNENKRFSLDENARNLCRSQAKVSKRNTLFVTDYNESKDSNIKNNIDMIPIVFSSFQQHQQFPQSQQPQSQSQSQQPLALSLELSMAKRKIDPSSRLNANENALVDETRKVNNEAIIHQSQSVSSFESINKKQQQKSRPRLTMAPNVINIKGCWGCLVDSNNNHQNNQNVCQSQNNQNGRTHNHNHKSTHSKALARISQQFSQQQSNSYQLQQTLSQSLLQSHSRSLSLQHPQNQLQQQKQSSTSTVVAASEQLANNVEGALTRLAEINNVNANDLIKNTPADQNILITKMYNENKQFMESLLTKVQQEQNKESSEQKSQNSSDNNDHIPLLFNSNVLIQVFSKIVNYIDCFQEMNYLQQKHAEKQIQRLINKAFIGQKPSQQSGSESGREMEAPASEQSITSIEEKDNISNKNKLLNDLEQEIEQPQDIIAQEPPSNYPIQVSAYPTTHNLHQPHLGQLFLCIKYRLKQLKKIQSQKFVNFQSRQQEIIQLTQQIHNYQEQLTYQKQLIQQLQASIHNRQSTKPGQGQSQQMSKYEKKKENAHKSIAFSLSKHQSKEKSALIALHGPITTTTSATSIQFLTRVLQQVNAIEQNAQKLQSEQAQFRQKVEGLTIMEEYLLEQRTRKRQQLRQIINQGSHVGQRNQSNYKITEPTKETKVSLQKLQKLGFQNNHNQNINHDAGNNKQNKKKKHSEQFLSQQFHLSEMSIKPVPTRQPITIIKTKAITTNSNDNPNMMAQNYDKDDDNYILKSKTSQQSPQSQLKKSTTQSQTSPQQPSYITVSQAINLLNSQQASTQL